MGFNCLKTIEPLRRDSLLFNTKSLEFPVLIWSTSEGRKAEVAFETPASTSLLSEIAAEWTQNVIIFEFIFFPCLFNSTLQRRYPTMEVLMSKVQSMGLINLKENTLLTPLNEWFLIWQDSSLCVLLFYFFCFDFWICKKFSGQRLVVEHLLWSSCVEAAARLQGSN